MITKVLSKDEGFQVKRGSRTLEKLFTKQTEFDWLFKEREGI
jgi:hypothetical protein